jgi:hypothetical protein
MKGCASKASYLVTVELKLLLGHIQKFFPLSLMLETPIASCIGQGTFEVVQNGAL